LRLRDYFSPLLKWWWLLILAALVTGATAYWATRSLPSVYQARATLLVGRGINDPNPTGNEIGVSQQLASAYADVATREPVQAATMAALGLSKLPTYDVQANGYFVEISVTHSDPKLAQAVANELANQLIVVSPASGQQTDGGRQSFVNQQLDEAQAQITQTKADIVNKQKALAGLSSAVDIANAQTEIDALQVKLTALETNYANLLASSQQGQLNTISLFEAASTPVKPIGPNKPLIILLAVLSGLVLAGGAAYLIEYLDNTLRREDVSRLLPYPVIGNIAELEHWRSGQIYVAENPRSMTTEAFRSLKTNLEFAAVDRPIRTLLVTSAESGDGKTLLASNLAFVLARAGKKVILLDSDLRVPGIHKSFGLSNSSGLSDIFLGAISVPNAVNQWPVEENLGIITSGTPAPNPAELIASGKMDEVLVRLKELADWVIIDSAPFIVADAWVLAAKVDAVLVVVRPGHTHREPARAMLSQLKRSGARVIGVALNRLPRAAAGYGYGGAYMAGYTAEARPTEKGRPKDRRAPQRQEQASLELLTAVSRLLSSRASAHDLWKDLLQLTVERMGATSGGLLLLDAGGTVVDGLVAYKGKVRTGLAEPLAEVAHAGLAGWVAAHRQGALVANTTDDPRWLRRPWDEPDGAARAVVSVPIVLSNGMIGVLTLAKVQAGYFAGDDLALLTAVASTIALSGLVAVPSSSAGPDQQPLAAPSSVEATAPHDRNVKPAGAGS